MLQNGEEDSNNYGNDDQNYNTENAEGYEYNYDYTEENGYEGGGGSRNNSYDRKQDKKLNEDFKKNINSFNANNFKSENRDSDSGENNNIGNGSDELIEC